MSLTPTIRSLVSSRGAATEMRFYREATTYLGEAGCSTIQVNAARPVPDMTFETQYTLEVGGETINLAWKGSNHAPDNIYIHLPDHETLILIDVVVPGWGSFAAFNIHSDVPGSIEAPATALSYPWKHFIGGHLGRLGTREDLAVHQEYIGDIVENVRALLGEIDPMPYYVILESLRLDLGVGLQIHP